jgi:GMP synthase PP-ATPase subunit
MKRNKKLSESIHEDCFRMENQATYIEGEKRDKPLYKNIIWTDGVLDYVDDMQFLQKDLWEKHGWPRAIYEVADGKRGAPYAVSMRIVKSPDAVTAQPLHIPFAYLQIMGDAIMNRCPQVGRVGYDISSKRPATIEIE